MISFLFAKGIISNPNNKFKQFVYEREIHEIVVNNKIYLLGKLDDKLQHLLRFYLPSQEKFNLEDVSVNPSPGIRFEMNPLILVSKLSAFEFETKPKLRTKNIAITFFNMFLKIFSSIDY